MDGCRPADGGEIPAFVRSPRLGIAESRIDDEEWPKPLQTFQHELERKTEPGIVVFYPAPLRRLFLPDDLYELALWAARNFRHPGQLDGHGPEEVLKEGANMRFALCIEATADQANEQITVLP